MRNPLPRWLEQLLAVACIAGALWLWLHAERSRAAASAVADAKIHAADSSAKAAVYDGARWQARYNVAEDTIKRLSAIVQRLRTADAGDTAWMHDTVFVRGEPRLAIPLPTLARKDSIARSCGALVPSIVPLTTSCDSTVAAAHRETAAEKDKAAGWQQKFEAVRPRWYDRCGLSGGVAILRDGTTVRAGPAVMVGCRVFP